MARFSSVDYTIEHIPKRLGVSWYVCGTTGNDSNDGRSPDSPLATIGQAITNCSAGASIYVGTAVYTETGLDLNKNAVGLWFETGAVIDPASGTAFTISGNYCSINNTNGFLHISPAAGETGLLISGNGAFVQNVHVEGGSSANLGFDITGSDCVLSRCHVSSPLTAAFKIQGDQNSIQDSCTGGSTGDSSIGFWITNSCDKIRLVNCGSQGHETAGYQVDAGCTNGCINKCTSGGGDGRWVDNGTRFSWPNFLFADTIENVMDFSTTSSPHNIFEFTGTIQITELYGIVETALSADVGNGYLQAYDGTNTVDVTDAPGPSFNSLPVGSLMHRTNLATNNITIENSSQVRLYEVNTGFLKADNPAFQLTAKNGATNYLRFVYSDAGTSGVIRWFVRWSPIDKTGLVS